VLAQKISFSPEHGESFFQELPAAAAAFLLRGQGEPYISKTANLRRRLQRILGFPKEQSKRLNLRNVVREIEFTATGSEFESQVLLYRLLRQTFPKTYSARLRLRPAPLVKLHLENDYPRASVATRLERLSLQEIDRGAPGIRARPDLAPPRTGDDRASKRNLYYGPFPSRAAAEKFASDALDFFKMRRCVEDLHPDPAFPGCVYSEMKMCLAPCFKGCTDEEYRTEVARVQSFFDTSGESLTRELAEQRDRASTELAFEEAAAVHAKIEKLKSVLSQLPEIVQRLDRLDAIILQASPHPDAVSVFRFRNAQITGPIEFRIHVGGQVSATDPSEEPGHNRTKPQTMESRVEESIAEFPVIAPASATECTEHLAILKRWYYRSSRPGEIFFVDRNGAWPLRRIVRGIGRVSKGEQPQELPSFFATQPVPPPS
jgi:excinuclease ABC subunit C